MEEKIDLAEAVRRAKEGGVGDAEFKRVKDFADWVTHRNITKKIRKSIKNYEQLTEQLKIISIQTRHLSNTPMILTKTKKLKK